MGTPCFTLFLTGGGGKEYQILFRISDEELIRFGMHLHSISVVKVVFEIGGFFISPLFYGGGGETWGPEVWRA